VLKGDRKHAYAVTHILSWLLITSFRTLVARQEHTQRIIV